MKCQNCWNILYLNKKNQLLYINYNIKINQLNIKWKCMIVQKNLLLKQKSMTDLYLKL